MSPQIRILPSSPQPSRKKRVPYNTTIGRLELILSLIDRDGYRCQLCNELLPADSWDAIDIDHIKPWSKGGSHDLDNLQLTHKACNVRKRNGLPRYSPEEAEARRQKSIRVRVAKADQDALEVQRLLASGLTVQQVASKVRRSRQTIYNLKARNVNPIEQSIRYQP